MGWAERRAADSSSYQNIESLLSTALLIAHLVTKTCMPRQKVLLGLPVKFQTWTLAAWLWPGPNSQLSKLSFRGVPSSTTICLSPPPDTAGLPDLYVWVIVQGLGAGDALGGPAHTGVNFGGNPANLGASPHDWGFAKKKDRLHRKLELFSVALGCKIKYEARLCAKALSRF